MFGNVFKNMCLVSLPAENYQEEIPTVVENKMLYFKCLRLKKTKNNKKSMLFQWGKDRLCRHPIPLR